MLELLSYPPIIRGFLLLIASATVFPIAGVWVLRLNLLPYRFMLMHGAMLGGALALALNWLALPLVLGVNIFLVLFADILGRRLKLEMGLSTLFLMVASLGAAIALVYSAQVPAQESLSLMWGNLFAVSSMELMLTLGFCFLLFLFAIFYALPIQALIFDADLAFSSGINVDLLQRVLLIVLAFTIAFAMRIVGALLLDALLLLPAILASVHACGLKQLYRRALAIGFFLGTGGFVLALGSDLPVGAAVALLGAAALGFILLIKSIKNYLLRKKKEY